MTTADGKARRAHYGPKKEDGTALTRFGSRVYKPALRCTNFGEEAIDRASKLAGLVVQLPSIDQYLRGRGAGLFRCRGDATDMCTDLVRAACDRLDIPGDLARRSALLLDGG